VLERVIKILSEKFNPEDMNKRITLHKGNIMDVEFLDKVFK
jgi:UDP-glucose 4-epimerase